MLDARPARTLFVMPQTTTRSFTAASAVEGVVRRTVTVRTPDGTTLAGTLRTPADVTRGGA